MISPRTSVPHGSMATTVSPSQLQGRRAMNLGSCALLGAAVVAAFFMQGCRGCSGGDRPPLAAGETFLLAYTSEDGALIVRMSADPATRDAGIAGIVSGWTDIAPPNLPPQNNTRGVGIAADGVGLNRLLVWGTGGRTLKLASNNLGTWADELGEKNVALPPGADSAHPPSLSAPWAAAHPDGVTWLVAMTDFPTRVKLLQYRQEGRQFTDLHRIPGLGFGGPGESAGRPVFAFGKRTPESDPAHWRQVVFEAELRPTGAGPNAVGVTTGTGFDTQAELELAGLTLLQNRVPEDQRAVAAEDAADVCVTYDKRGSFYLGVLTRGGKIRLYRMDEQTGAIARFGPAEASTLTLPVAFARHLQCAARPGGGGLLVLTVGDAGPLARLVNATAATSFPAEHAFVKRPRNEPFALVAAGMP